MPRRTLTLGDWDAQFHAYTTSAWRWERQPFYASDVATGWPARWLSGDRTFPADYLGRWLDEVRARTVAGRTMERVRVVDEPMTDRQRWADWAADFNREAGEVIHRLSRPAAGKAGLLDDAPTDFWLMDGGLVLFLVFDAESNLVEVEADNEPATIRWAIDVRDRATAAVEVASPRA